jgi:hypothetical protein
MELEKIFEIAVNGSNDEKISVAMILCGASLIWGWNLQVWIFIKLKKKKKKKITFIFFRTVGSS